MIGCPDPPAMPQSSTEITSEPVRPKGTEMSSTIVRYQLDSARLDEHLALIDDVFAHLADASPDGVDYQVFRSGEGMDFTHIATFESDDAQRAFGSSPAFQAFTADIAARCVTPPAPAAQIHVHTFRN